VELRAALDSAINQLSKTKVPSARMNAEILLMFSLNRERAYLYAHPERELTEDETVRYREAIAQRSSGIPAQYITGHQEFWGMDLIVSPAVLIPRPETEQNPGKPMCMVDVGTGSGCIALALSKELPQAEISATDISAAALEIARANASRLELESRIQFRQADLLEGVDPESIGMIVSNPPYVGESEEDKVQLEVRKFEPRNAVFAGPTGTEVIARLIPQAQTALKPGGWLVMEISGTIVEGVKRLLQGWEQLRIVDDLQRIARVVAARKPW
jgi:release factor glutamine methyltransferase